jgi:hypothetical protein
LLSLAPRDHKADACAKKRLKCKSPAHAFAKTGNQKPSHSSGASTQRRRKDGGSSSSKGRERSVQAKQAAWHEEDKKDDSKPRCRRARQCQLCCHFGRARCKDNVGQCMNAA